ncbi:MAG TPA: UPF0182 family protein [Mycobacteriales bacterium]|nr:UPF0182 family protein [Mycobacteriales bacterium]
MAFRPPAVLRPKVAAPIVIAIVIIIVLATAGVTLYVNFLFYREVHYSSVYSTIIRTKILLFFIGGSLLAITTGVNAVLAYRLRPPFRPVSLEQQNLDRYRVVVQPYLVPILIAFTGLVGIIAGISASHHWQTWQLWRHATSFGAKDPQFNRDVGYYAFIYPFRRFVLGLLFQAVLLSTIVAAVVHYLFGGIRLQTPGDKAVPAAKAHLSVLLGLLLLLKAWAYYLDRYGLNFSHRGFVDTGASYTDIHVVLPAKLILLVVSVLCAVLFFVNARLRGWTLPAISVGLLLFASVVIGGIVPAIYQHFSVKPNEAQKEAPYISRNITATQDAYKITQGDKGDVTIAGYPTNNPQVSQVTKDTGTVPNARLLDPNVVGSAFEGLQQLKNYYGFAQDLDVDRYTNGSQTQEYVVGARDVNIGGLDSSQRNWINTHLVYTHGQGFVAAPTNQVDSVGRPVFDSDVGGSTDVQSRVYFGEKSPTYSVVHTKQSEVDGPDPSQKNSYDGKGGVGIGSFFRKTIFALKFKDTNLLLSSALTSQSKILYYRDPRTRVQKVAPWLTVDNDPYPAVVGGRLVYILDGYTTSDAYPYSARTSLASATTDTTGRAQSGQVNYIRNSVKATVDAGDGTVTLYAWDDTDAVLKAWESVFPGTVKPKDQIPTELMQHFRYPEDLFKVQRDLLTRYYVTDPQTFYQQNQFWSVPSDPSVGQNGPPLPPYYVLSQVPGQASTQFNLTSTLTALQRPNATAYMSIASGTAPGLDTQSEYGHITLLELTDEPNGPGQVQSNFNSFPAFSQQRTLLSSAGSTVTDGNLLALPVGGQLLWVEPIYVTGSGAQIPSLKYILVSYGGGTQVGFAPDYKTALSDALNGTSTGVSQIVSQTPPTGTPSPGASPSVTPTPTASAPSTTPASGTVEQQLQQLLQQQSEINQKLDQLLAELASKSAKPSPTAKPSG